MRCTVWEMWSYKGLNLRKVNIDVVAARVLLNSLLDSFYNNNVANNDNSTLLNNIYR